MMASAQRRLADLVAGSARGSIPEAARGIARQSLLDTVAVAFAGRREPVNARAVAYAAGTEQPQGASVWLAGSRHVPETASLLNAVAAHALDYDDVTPAWRGHPGAVLWPALCAVSGAMSCTYGELLDAFVLGFEVGAQLGAEVNPHHYAAGWHATSTVGVIAGAAACARVLALDGDQVFHALGLAAAQSAGLQANFGSMGKPLQAGFAAAAAVRAAGLARAGAEAGDVLEGRNGFASLYGSRQTLQPDVQAFGASPAILRAGIEVKQFPNCYAAHRAVEAALLLRSEIGDVPRSVRAILVEGTPGAHQPLLRRPPANADEARFSVEFAVACVLVDGGVRLGTFHALALERPEIRELMARTRAEESDRLATERAARVTIELVDGRRLERTVTTLPGRFGEPAFMRRLHDKVVDCMGSVGLEQRAQPLWEAVLETPDEARGGAVTDSLLADVVAMPRPALGSRSATHRKALP